MLLSWDLTFNINLYNNLSNSYNLIDDLLHSKNLLFRADVKGRNSPIYQNFHIYICICTYTLQSLPQLRECLGGTALQNFSELKL